MIRWHPGYHWGIHPKQLLGRVMKISTTVGYAIAALLQLANHRIDSPLSTSSIASSTDMPERYLLQIMKTLKDAGLVVAMRGVKGGYRLAKPIGRISLQDVCDAIDGPHMPEQMAIQMLNAASQRVITNALADIADDERRHLSGFTLDALKLGK